MQWKCLPVPHEPDGTPAIHYTTVYKVFAKWADDDSLWQAFVASVRHLAAEKQLDLSVLHGDGTNTVAKKGGMVSGSRGTNIRKATRSSPLRRTKAMSSMIRPKARIDFSPSVLNMLWWALGVNQRSTEARGWNHHGVSLASRD